VTNRREIRHRIHAVRCIPFAGRRNTVTSKCVCGRDKMLEAAEALDGTRLEHPGLELDMGQDASRRTTSFVSVERACEKDEMLEAACLKAQDMLDPERACMGLDAGDTRRPLVCTRNAT
jgi:hypothetical protein